MRSTSIDMNTDNDKPLKPKNFCSRKKLFVFCIVTLITLFASTSLFLSHPRTHTGKNEALPHHYIGFKDLTPYPTDSSLTPCEDKDRNKRTYDLLGNDTLIVIHIQKTGGSDFLRHVVTVRKNGTILCDLPEYILLRVQKRLSLPKGKQRIFCPKRKSDANTTQWLLSEKTVGWKCGVHPTFSEYHNCIQDLDVGEGSEYSQYQFMTILRHPVLRFLSEFEHVSRGAHWSARKKCGGKKVTDSEMPPCYPRFYEGESWPKLTLNDYLACKSNWAKNRQVMWLAELETAGCYNPNFENRDALLLASAKCNLEKLSFFGLTEYQKETAFMFEKVFNVTFSVPPEQYDMTFLHSAPILRDIWKESDLYERIVAVNDLDMQLYEHALRLFARRAKTFGLNTDIQKVDESVREIHNFNINMTAKKFTKGIFDISEHT